MPAHFRRRSSLCKSPKKLNGVAFVKRLYEKHRTVIAGSRNKLAGKVIRIGTMGYVSEEDILTDLRHLEDVLPDLGFSGNAGSRSGGSNGVSSAIAFREEISMAGKVGFRVQSEWRRPDDALLHAFGTASSAQVADSMSRLRARWMWGSSQFGHRRELLAPR